MQQNLQVVCQKTFFVLYTKGNIATKTFVPSQLSPTWLGFYFIDSTICTWSTLGRSVSCCDWGWSVMSGFKCHITKVWKEIKLNWMALFQWDGNKIAIWALINNAKKPTMYLYSSTRFSNTRYQKYWQSPIMKINAQKENLDNFYLAYDVKICYISCNITEIFAKCIHINI